MTARKRAAESKIWPYTKAMRDHTRGLLPTLRPKVMHALLLDMLDAMDNVEEIMKEAFADAKKAEEPS